MPTTIKVLFLAAEAEPYIKVGGLADVAGTLPLALRKLSAEDTRGVKIDVRLVLPLHPSSRVKRASLQPLAEVSVYRRGGNIDAQIYKTSRKRMPVYFIDGDPISSAPTVYSPDPAVDREKYTFFSLAALEMLRHIDWQPDIIHANDWHTALGLFALRTRRSDPVMRRMRTLLTVHNLPFMGGDATDVLSAYGLMPPTDESLPRWARTQSLPLGLWSADAIIPVSPTYAREILTPDFGCGLDPYLNTRVGNITGILNGLDLSSFDPETDRNLAAQFTVESLNYRSENKRALQKQLNLPIDASVPILAMVGRIDRQKGVDIAINVLEGLGDESWQFVILGSGDQSLEIAARNLQSTFSDRVRGNFRYDAHLGKMIYGGADIFLMPSRYEPCGLAQLIAMRYGCVPVVRATGGLKDTVRNGKTGFVFQEASKEAMRDAVKDALRIFRTRKEKWQEYRRNCMLEDFSWPRSARQYAIIYRSLIAS
jgi:starch synthase